MSNTTKIITTLAIVVIVIVGMKLVITSVKTPAKYEVFAQCLKDKGVKFYGAFWCPHCQAQEKDFGMSRQSLQTTGLYTECSNSDGQSQTQICIDNKITSYPTWKFPDGTELTGETPLATLAEKSSCPLPAK